MNDLFKCKNCGAPRSYINQYCPICESSGPHIPAGSKASRSQPVKRKVNPAPSRWDDFMSDEETVVSKRKDTPKKEKKRDSFKQHEEKDSTDDDKEMRSLWTTGRSAKPISRKTWRSIAIAAVAVLALILIVVNLQAIALQFHSAGKWITELMTFHPPAATTANTTGNSTGTDNKTAQVSTQAPVTNPASTTPIGKKPDVPNSSNQTGAQTPATNPTDTTRPGWVEKPVAHTERHLGNNCMEDGRKSNFTGKIRDGYFISIPIHWGQRHQPQRLYYGAYTGDHLSLPGNLFG